MLPCGPEGELCEPASPCSPWELGGEPLLLAVEPEDELELEGLGSEALGELELEVEGLGIEGLDWLGDDDGEGMAEGDDDGEDGVGMLGVDEELDDELVVSQPASAAQRAPAAIMAASGRC